MLAGPTKPAEDEISTLEPPSTFMVAAHILLESSTSGKIEITKKETLTGVSAQEKNRRRSPGTFFKNPAGRKLGSSRQRSLEINRLWYGQS